MGSELFEVKVVAAESEILHDVSNDSTRYIARMPCESDQPIRMKRIRVMPMSAGNANKSASNLF